MDKKPKRAAASSSSHGLPKLRRGKPLFSHAIVHDALFIEDIVQESEIQDAFCDSMTAEGIGPLRISRKSWNTAEEKTLSTLNSMVPPYDPLSSLSKGKVQRPQQNTHGQQSMWRYMGKLLKREYESHLTQ